MANEEKQLLLQDLCARLPYGVIVKVSKEDNGSVKSYNKPFDAEIYNLLLLNGGYVERGIIYHYSQFSLKPYLRPMSSMTSKEESELCKILGCGCINAEYAYFNWSVGGSCDKDDMNIDIETFGIVVDWLNEHHFDYRGLIEKGLALEAPDGMYNNN